MSVKVFSKDGKPDRVVTTATQETAAVFDGFREVKAEEPAKAEDKRTDAEREADEQAAKAKPAAPKPQGNTRPVGN
jgi:hypothetical protein